MSNGSDVDRAHITARYDDIDSVGRSSDLPLLLSGPIPALVRAFVGAFGRTHEPVPCSVSPSAIYGDATGSVPSKTDLAANYTCIPIEREERLGRIWKKP